jgi:hypothetical protein
MKAGLKNHFGFTKKIRRIPEERPLVCVKINYSFWGQ